MAFANRDEFVTSYDRCCGLMGRVTWNAVEYD